MDWWEVVTVFNTACYWLPILIRSYITWKVKRVSRNNGSVESDTGDRLDIERSLRGHKAIKVEYDRERDGEDQGRGKFDPGQDYEGRN